jgi:hypothetical protein
MASVVARPGRLRKHEREWSAPTDRGDPDALNNTYLPYTA